MIDALKAAGANRNTMNTPASITTVGTGPMAPMHCTLGCSNRN